MEHSGAEVVSDLLELTPALAEEVSRGAGFSGDAVRHSRWSRSPNNPNPNPNPNPYPNPNPNPLTSRLVV